MTQFKHIDDRLIYLFDKYKKTNIQVTIYVNRKLTIEEQNEVSSLGGYKFEESKITAKIDFTQLMILNEKLYIEKIELSNII
jgi:hypothetical protein